ncbi:MAG: hypothetical protein V4508_22910 [Pseudomonadota bacterium]
MADHAVEIQTQYLAYLGRPADAPGLAFWSAALDRGTPLTVLGQALAASAEYQFAQRYHSNAQVISSFYSNLFGAPGDAAGNAYWAAAVQQQVLKMEQLPAMLAAAAQGADLANFNARLGVSLAIEAHLDTATEMRAYGGKFANDLAHDYLAPVHTGVTCTAAIAPAALDALAEQIVLGPAPVPDAIRLVASHRLDVQQLYVGYLGRPADPQGLEYFGHALDANSVTMPQLVGMFGASAEFQALNGQGGSLAVIAGAYARLFSHAPDASGLLLWNGLVESGRLGVGTVVAAIASGAQGADKLVLDAKDNVAAAIDAALDTTAEILSYTGSSANALVSNYLAQVRDADSYAAAMAPAAINGLVLQLGDGPPVIVHGAPEPVALVGQAEWQA